MCEAWEDAETIGKVGSAGQRTDEGIKDIFVFVTISKDAICTPLVLTFDL